MPNIKIALCQLNPTIGDFNGNLDKAAAAIHDNDADIYVFPECFVSNYPSGDLYLDRTFVACAEEHLNEYQKLVTDNNKTIIIGAPRFATDPNKKAFNSAFLIDRHGISLVADKRHLPNYGVFDDERWFTTSDKASNTVDYHDADGNLVAHICICICEDIWFSDVIKEAADRDNADFVISINSSPYSIAKAAFRRKVFEDRVMESHIPLIYVNQVGGNDELVWDGASAALDGHGNYHEMEPWKEEVSIVELTKENGSWKIANSKAPVEQPFDMERYTAACIGLRDYVHKNGFKKVVLGLSGGADSALVGLMAADVFGVDNVDFITMPTRYTSGDSNDFAKLLGHGMGSGSRVHTVPVQTMVDTFLKGFTDTFGSQKPNVAEENLQAQLRGDILSFFSNKFSAMILSTGNKSEIAMGYATLYGDMRGGFNPLKDLYKTEVFELLEMRHRIGFNALNENVTQDDISSNNIFRNAFGHDLVSLNSEAVEALRKTIDRPPSAELAEGQKDSDSLPDYSVLDKILWNMIDHKESLTDDQVAAETGYNLELVKSVRNRVRLMEYKRFQACPGPKIHRKAFIGLDWRHPMSSKFRA